MSAISVPYVTTAAGVRDRIRALAGVPTWARPGTLVLALATFVLYAWGLDRNGFANTYYSAAVLAGTQSWKAFFFGSLDSGNFITVDKPPASLWLMELSARLFGVSSWSILLPEALAGALCVLLVVVSVRRAFGPAAGLIAGVVTALTPVAVLMFRYNNPDALLTLLLVASAWALTRALDGGRLRWLLLSAGFVGLAFNTKDLQAYIVVPALVLTYLLFAAGALRRRFLELVAAGGVLLLSSGWWLTVVDLIPAASRPYIGGSTDNSVLNLVLGYNGLGRIFGQGGPAGGGRGGGGGNGFGGAAGLFRLFNSEIGGQITWLLPFNAAALIGGLWLHWREPRTSLKRAGYVLWGGWLVTHFVVFSLASGIFHPYYTVAMAPAVGALAGGGVVDLWKLRGRSILGAALLGAALAVSGWWAAQLLNRTPSFLPGLATLVIFLSAAAALVLLVTRFPVFARMYSTRVPVAALVAGAAALLLGPAAYSLQTIANSYNGPIPSAGPASTDGGFAFRDGGAGGTSSQLIGYLEQNEGSATWLVAVQSAQSAASIELETGKAVLAMGGFSGSDPAPNVQQLKQLISEGKLRYVLLGIGGGPGGGMLRPPGDGGFEGPPPGAGAAQAPPGARASGTQPAVQWVQQSCTEVTVAGVSGLYDCSSATG